MCSLCGILGCDDHWTNAVDRPGVYSRNRDSQSRRMETARRLKAVNRIASYRRLRLEVWQGRSYVLSSATGASSVFEALSHLWPEAEALAGRAFDPLDEGLIAWMEGQRT
ncbi:hypothetical protein KM176_19700 [Pseudooceanicola sp. CBS1P-1]|uniref:Uncharacterized protein n=1 Tax=Pseudooceanicola albus TaxID=2692189 RepID=A0A6L7G7A7_9RHOB|nr:MULTISPECIES: hypothetical protein [Pseudooceanicola]MBT9386105.1 hypothetical protein [Pseudooceanicola endophyticus]MXN19477.1 hypothetical protein [Pseudooceanicola albus]